jgi:hypothetical protein
MDQVSGWVPVFVPAELAPDVLRRVAEFVRSGSPVGSPSDWADATTEDLEGFFQDIPDIEWRLITELSQRDRPAPVAELAEVLDVEVGAVAGAIGPINKRAKRQSWGPPIQPTRYFPEGSRTAKRGLLLADAIKSWIRSRDGESDKS